MILQDINPKKDTEVLYPFIPNNLTAEEKVDLIASHFEKILETLGLDLTDDSLCKTPYRYAKMLVNELFVGLDHKNFPSIMTQENKFKYTDMVIESNISVRSVCEHHFVPILGSCHIAYIPNKKVIGLSKLNRVAQFYASRPQVQERMTRQIRDKLSQILETESVAVTIDASHLCVKMRGVKDSDALTRTSDLGGQFLETSFSEKFFRAVPSLRSFKV